VMSDINEHPISILLTLHSSEICISKYPQDLKLRLPHRVRNHKVMDNTGQNTSGLLAGCSYGVNDTTCFGLLGCYHQVYKC